MKSILSLLLLVCFTYSGQAQILDRLADKAAKSAERTLDRKVEQKAQKETEKAFDSTFNTKQSSKKSKKKTVASADKTPDAVYTFTHKYVMQMENDKYNTNLTYYLAKDKNYLGSTMEAAATMFTVMDMDKQSLFMFTEASGTKMLMATNMDLGSMVENNQEEKDVKFEKTGRTKSILGYNCSEYNITSSDMKGNFWITQDAGVSFPKGFQDIAEKSKNSNQAWMANMEGIMMEMHITDTSKRKEETMTMRCVALEKSDFKINTKDYKKFM